MTPITPDDIKTIEDYEIGRDEFRKRIMEIKAPRRVHVGDHFTFLFENRETLIYQIQEMLRVEGIRDLVAIRHEIDTYNELLPDLDEISATLMIEYADEDERSEGLVRLVGLDGHVSLAVEGLPPTQALFDQRQMSEDRISSVHYLKFKLWPPTAAAILGGGIPTIIIDHPAMTVSAALTAEQAAALAQDLATEVATPDDEDA